MRILIVRLSALGDIVHALPVLAALGAATAVRGAFAQPDAPGGYDLGPGFALIGLFLAGLFDPVHLNAQTGAILGGTAGSILGQASQIVPGVVVMKYGREAETQADLLGAQILARAGYDPRAAVSLWNKMSSVAGKGGPPKFLSTHPAAKDRIKDIEKNLPRVLPLYQPR